MPQILTVKPKLVFKPCKFDVGSTSTITTLSLTHPSDMGLLLSGQKIFCVINNVITIHTMGTVTQTQPIIGGAIVYTCTGITPALTAVPENVYKAGQDTQWITVDTKDEFATGVYTSAIIDTITRNGDDFTVNYQVADSNGLYLWLKILNLTKNDTLIELSAVVG